MRSAFQALALVPAAALFSALAFASPAAALEQKLTASDGAAGDNVGRSVAIDGDTIVLGAPEKNNDRGAAYVFKRVGDSWTQTAKLTATDAAQYDLFGTSVAIDGDTIVVGAPGTEPGAETDSNFNLGTVYTFTRTGAATRTETARLTASDGGNGDYLGYSVAIDGDTIAAGAAYDDVGANEDRGSAYTFARTGAAARTQTAKLTATNGGAFDFLGISVAIDGDTIVAGAPNTDAGDSGSHQGSAYTFARTGAAARTETARLNASDGESDDKLGTSVAIDGDTIVAGAPNHTVGATYAAGSAYTFARTGLAVRTETARLAASDDDEEDSLGISVAIDGDTIVAGAIGSDVGDRSYGSAYTFARTGAATRTETARLTSSDGALDDYLGYSVAIDGDAIVAGTPGDAFGAKQSQGSASVFFAPAPDSDNDGVPDSVDNCPNTPGPASNGGCPDTSPPETTINKTTVDQDKRKAIFRFSSTEPNSIFRCKLDDSRFRDCGSPKTYTELKTGRHTFKVLAIDQAGNRDPTPAVKEFRING